ncbi:MAG: 30S ribosomal protein S8 [Planctomycetes bacterium]|nr:30S ribosomal protein S8 [Planctomycetota bacterium]
MSMTDPVADLLTRIRNGNTIRMPHVDVPASNMKRGVVDCLKKNGYVRDYRVIEDGVQGSIRVYLKYGPDGEFVINRIQRVSKPGRRVYSGVDNIPSVLNGLGIAILSTSKGIMSDHEARSERLGGEVLAEVW